MRFSILLIALALLPMTMIIHGWFYAEKQVPMLEAEALKALVDQGIRAAVVDVRYLDLRIAGNAPDADALMAAQQSVKSLGPLRLVKNDLTIPASLRAQQEGDQLMITGWLPEAASIQHVRQLLTKLRPDLKMSTDGIRVHPQVSWPEGEKTPVTAESSLLLPILSKLRVAPWLDIQRDQRGLHAAGLLPFNGLKGEILSVLKPMTGEDLQESTHILPADFVKPDTLVPFLKVYFSDDSPRRVAINDREGPLLEAPATRGQESEWLALLRPVTGGKRVDLRLTLYPSIFHFPGRKLVSSLSPEESAGLAQALRDALVTFAPKSTTLTAAEQSRLAALTPLLLRAGPALKLVIGGHPSPTGAENPEKKLALARAEQVLSYLVEQGLPTSDVKTMAFDPVPVDTPGAPAQPQSVEIILR